MMVDCFNFSFEVGTLSTTQNQNGIILLENPEKDIRYKENWRPISLINVDAKVCSKALCNRLIDLMPALIHPNQAAFIKGRNIDEPLRFIADLFDYCERSDDRSYILFAADFQKAFDSVEHNFILAVLGFFGFGHGFIRWIKILLTNSKSCIINNGEASVFFELKRGTKQGDPISPYLFILTIEILAQLIRNNKEIKGLRIDERDEETKLVLYADDTTFCLKDQVSLENVLECLEQFQIHSSLQLNYDKSEVGWIGRKHKELSETRIKKKVDFRVRGVKILGIYFSHNKAFMRNNNFDRVFEKFKSVLSIWKMRNLTLFGKSHIIRSLALSQLLYISSKIAVPRTFIDSVDRAITNFIWNGRKPKIKYKTLIGDFFEGGLRVPDLETMIKANHVGWVLKLLDNKENTYWKCFARYCLESYGGLEVLRENFDSSRVKNENVSAFYKEILDSWCLASGTKVETVEEILRQPIWLNKYVHLDLSHVNARKLVKKGILDIRDVWDCNYGFQWESVKAKGKWCNTDYFAWRCIVTALPSAWKRTLKDTPPSYRVQESNKGIEIGNIYTPLSKITTKKIYWEIMKNKFKTPTAQKYISDKLSIPDIEWRKVYQSVFKITNEIRLRAFQYKVLQNCLYLNKDLYKFKIIESPNCSFCYTFIETIDHFFVECHYSKELFYKIKEWLEKANVRLPELNLKNVILGGDRNIMEEFLFLLYKYVLYNARIRGCKPNIMAFQMKLVENEKIENIIARKNGKLHVHVEKYQKLQVLLSGLKSDLQ